MDRISCAVLLAFALAAGGCDCGSVVEIPVESPNPAAAQAAVAGAVKARSPNYQLITTTSPAGGNPSSRSFTVRSGVVGGTQSTVEVK